MKLVQCWDDGVTTDIRLVEILRRHGAKATFNLNAGLHGALRTEGWMHEGTLVQRLAWSEMRDVYEGFTIANHSLTHPALDRLPIADARRDITQGRERLQQRFSQSVLGFAYPFGAYNNAVMTAVREAGHAYARTTGDGCGSFPPSDAMELHPSCHFLAPDFWMRYEQARGCGVFHFWGHSYEMTTEAMWSAFESTITRLGSDPAARWCDVPDLFSGNVR
jgi:peptidoglycan/xylan/chitin deacetylase (PgdA/CDA1 family)